jgi:protein SCO1/2
VKRPAHFTRLCSLAAFVFASACTDPALKLPEYGTIPQFTMTDSEGHPFTAKALDGKVWIADVIYTNCPAECPRMTAQMHKIEQQVKGDPNLRLVSISVDPQRDTPSVLSAFAKRFGGPTPQWTFLTGSPETVHLIAYQTFHVGDVIGKIEHSTKFVLIDKRGHLRGYYSAFDADSVNQMLKDAAALERSTAPPVT